LTEALPTEIHAELEPPVPPEPEPAEPETAEPDIASQKAVASADKPDQEAEADDAPAAAHELAFPVGSASQQIIDSFLDGESTEQSMNQIKAALSHIDPNTVEGAANRLRKRGRLLRVSPGVYRLGPVHTTEVARPAEPVPQPEPAQGDVTDQQWFDALEAHLIDPASWDPQKLGPPPVSPDHKIPADIFARFADRVRKREQRRREAEAAAAKRAEADRELREKLLESCRHGSRQNYAPELVGADLTPVKMLLALGASIDVIELAVRWRTETEVLSSWHDEWLLRKAWEFFGRIQILPRLMQGRAEAPPKPAGASEAVPAVQVPPNQENAQSVSSEVPGSISGDEPGGPDQAEVQVDMRGALAKSGDQDRGVDDLSQDQVVKPEDDQETTTTPAPSPTDTADIMSAVARAPAADRESILRAFRRTEASAQPAQRQPAPNPGRPWFAGPREQPQPRHELNEAAVDELIQGWKSGNLAWPKRFLGEYPPGHPGCQLSRETLRRNGL
jgi:hypothetical protein